MTAPAPKRRLRSWDPKAHYRQKAVYIPKDLANRLTTEARRSDRSEKAVIIEALEKRLPVAGPTEPADDSSDD